MDPSIVFVGSGEWGQCIARALKRTKTQLTCIITAPDMQEAFGRLSFDCPIRVFENWDALGDILSKADLAVCGGWGKIPFRVLNLPRRGFVNVHGSLLPKYRGPEPLERQYLAGETNIGVSLHQLEKKIDAGGVFAQKAVTVSPAAHFHEWMVKLTLAAHRLVAENVAGIADGAITSAPQREENATYFSFLKPDDGRIQLTDDSLDIFRRIDCLGLRGWAQIESGKCAYYLADARIMETDYQGPRRIQEQDGTAVISVPPHVLTARIIRKGALP